MNLILFIHQDAPEKGATLLAAIDRELQGVDIQVIQSVNMLKERLKRYSDLKEHEIYILLVDSSSRFNQLTPLCDLLEDKRLIFLLPDESKTTMAKAHQFFPRFLACINHSYEDLCAVLQKMTDQSQRTVQLT